MWVQPTPCRSRHRCHEWRMIPERGQPLMAAPDLRMMIQPPSRKLVAETRKSRRLREKKPSGPVAKAQVVR